MSWPLISRWVSVSTALRRAPSVNGIVFEWLRLKKCVYNWIMRVVNMALIWVLQIEVRDSSAYSGVG
jgi:hypothetical protein